jgi:2-aminoadipate transaminase
MIAYELAKDGFLNEHIQVIRRAYRERRDTMLAAMAEYFPGNVSWTHPEGGMFLWVTLPTGINTTALLQAAIEQQVAFVPGEPFYPGNGMHNTMRLNYSYDKPERIYEGIKRLASVLQSFVDSHEMQLSHL